MEMLVLKFVFLCGTVKMASDLYEDCLEKSSHNGLYFSYYMTKYFPDSPFVREEY